MAYVIPHYIHESYAHARLSSISIDILRILQDQLVMSGIDAVVIIVEHRVP